MSARRRVAAAVVLSTSVLITVFVALGIAPGEQGTVVAVALPWLPALLIPLVAAGFVVRRRTAWITLVPLVAWALALGAFLPVPWQQAPSASPTGLLVATQNVQAGSGTGGDSARTLARTGAGVLAFTELDQDSRAAVAEALAGSHPYSYTVGTVGVWSRYPIADEQPLELGLGWKRALTVRVDAPGGAVSLYVVHAASLRPGVQTQRDTMLSALGAVIADDRSPRVIALGDFNAVSTDPALAAVSGRLSEVRFGGFGPSFTWPASFPAARIDHVFQRGYASAAAATTSAGGSDHLAIVASLQDG